MDIPSPFGDKIPPTTAALSLVAMITVPFYVHFENQLAPHTRFLLWLCLTVGMWLSFSEIFRANNGLSFTTIWVLVGAFGVTALTIALGLWLVFDVRAFLDP